MQIKIFKNDAFQWIVTPAFLKKKLTAIFLFIYFHNYDGKIIFSIRWFIYFMKRKTMGKYFLEFLKKSVT